MSFPQEPNDSRLYFHFSIHPRNAGTLATHSDKMETGKEGLIDKSSQVVAVYRFVIIDGRPCIDDSPEQGVWISRETTGKKFTYTAHLARKGWKVSFGGVYCDSGVITAMKSLDLNDDLKRLIDRNPGDKEGRGLEIDLPQEAYGVAGGQVEARGKRPEWSIILHTPMKARGGAKDNNNNDLLRFVLIHHPLGTHGACREELALWWAKKEVSGNPMTGLSGAELERFKLEGRIAQT